jgi:hypothetical protein
MADTFDSPEQFLKALIQKEVSKAHGRFFGRLADHAAAEAKAEAINDPSILKEMPLPEDIFRETLAEIIDATMRVRKTRAGGRPRKKQD